MYVTPNSLLYLIINNATRYIEERNGNKYLALVPTDKGKDTLKKYEKMLGKINDYEEEYMKIKFNPDDDLP